jgi:hypothetical protein
MRLTGTALDGTPKLQTFHITARSGDGGYIPCIPAILLARRLARNQTSELGAMPCMGLIGLRDYLDGLADLEISHSPID